MRIAILNTLYPPSKVGGAERSVAVLAKGLADAGHAVHAIALTDGDRQSEEQLGGVTVHRIPHGNHYWPFDGRPRRALTRLAWHWRDRGTTRLTDTVRRLLLRIAPEVLHSNNLTGFGSGIVPMARELGLPVVHTLRDFSLLCARASLYRGGLDCGEGNGGGRCLPCRAITGPRMARAQDVDLVVGNSDYMVERHRSFGLFEEKPARTIYNAVPSLGERAESKVRRLDGAPMRFGFAGMIKPEKGIEVLFDACAALPPGGWNLTIAGSGDAAYIEQLRARSATLPVKWLGFVPIETFFAQVDCVVIPSLWPEPMPRMLIEAMAEGLPAIVSDAGGAPEVAASYPAAQLYPRRDRDALAGLLRAALAAGPQPRRIDPDLAERFGVARLVDEYLAAYRQAIALRKAATHA